MEEMEFFCEGFFLPLISVEEMDIEYVVAAPAPAAEDAGWDGFFEEEDRDE